MSKIDNTDYRIVNLLMEDGRMPAAKIARRLGDITERAVRYRINRLVEDSVIQISAIPNPRALGYSVIADVFIEVEPSCILDVAHNLARQDCVSYVSCAIGELDVSAQVVGKSNEEIYQFATQYIGNLPGVRKTTTSIVPLTIKDIYEWRIPLSEVEDDNE